ncbi:NAD(P)/FAD-dependent oxidoreductase [Nocardioides lijunqiniae]|uniref:NAD(P)/FAD-dependent oxidoreductase n=1 Tax=Nocardioides lijunqiniae TaxID=2760832 RepID=UPI0018776CD9|nr:FAD-dependent oxidoreductase [Nocardioides lijunqiniae]
MTTPRPERILVIGGGYAGVLCANRLAGRLGSRARITLVNPIEPFVERVRLHEVAARTDAEPATRHSLRSLLRPSVGLRIARVTRIRPDAHRVDGVEGAENRPWTDHYDTLVYAVGSGVPVGAVPGAAEHAHNISSLEAAQALRRRLAQLSDDASVLIVGGGATAIELVTELASRRPSLRLSIVTSSRLAPTLSVKARRYLEQAQAMSYVDVVEHTPVTEVTRTGVRTDQGEELAADCVVWAASFAVPTLARDSGLEVDRSGRLVVDECLRTARHPDILGAGDGSVILGPSGATLRMACATAIPQGGHAAATVIAGLEGRSPEPFALAYLVLAMSLGPGDGLVQRTRFDDTPSGTVLTGRPAAAFNELNTRYARSVLAWERTRAGAYRWAKPPTSARREGRRRSGRRRLRI